MASYNRYTEASFIQVSWPTLVIWATLQRFVVGGITAPFSTFIILVLAPKHYLQQVEFDCLVGQTGMKRTFCLESLN